MSPHVVEGIYDNNDQGGLGQLKKAIETKELNQVHISAEDMALIKQGFYQVANGTSGLTTGKLLVKVPVSPLVPRQVRPKPQSMEANKPLIPMWWLMHRQTIQRLQ